MFSNEPVATASGATIVAGGLVTLGSVTGLYHLDTETAVVVVGAVFAIVSGITSWWARRRVTPVTKATTTTTTGASGGST